MSLVKSGDHLQGWVNPGGSGYVDLKVFRVDDGIRLSADRIAEPSNELTGWSEDVDTLFYYNSDVTVYEGDWDHHYDARFELWFHPSDGGPERKLVEVARAICGWER